MPFEKLPVTFIMEVESTTVEELMKQTMSALM